MAVMIGQPAPAFAGTAVVGGPAAELTPDNAFTDISLDGFKGRWVVLFFYPLDFTFVCPTEIAEFGRQYADFRDLDAEIIAVSTDSKHSHLAWRRHEEKLVDLPYMMLADPTRQIARDYNVLIESKGFALRGTFIIDPDGVLQYMVVHNEDVGRSVDETLRVLEALQTGELCPCNWKAGQPTL
ncbi:MAG TPA: peroxiredoxin [Candidatus Kapabacteria bacterium]|nr:peroxiredoxin [Candidatus Kapabacteria bacterium]